MAAPEARIGAVRATAYRIPTDAPEADGTFAWDSTTLVLVEVDAGGKTGLGYTYASAAAAGVVRDTLADVVVGLDALQIPALWDAMVRQVRNLGSRGVCACAISAVDVALWDLKARLLDMALADLLGRRRDAVDVYGSGGFTTYDHKQLMDQLSGWVAEGGCRWVKIKIGAEPLVDIPRIETARTAIGEAGLFVDANGALARKAALWMAEAMAGQGVSWFEEPVSSDDLEGLRLLRDRAPAGMDIAAGEYGFEPFYFRRMLDAGAVDVLQADATRCWGITGFLAAAALADAAQTPLSSHCAPALHLHAACAAPRLRHIEWFHDHARIESLLFDGAPKLRGGRIAPDASRPGHGLTLRRADAEPYAI
jgi:L-alanine-DL-glutamate epimerase-like enolase superfamily enzyme